MTLVVGSKFYKCESNMVLHGSIPLILLLRECAASTVAIVNAY